MGNIQLFIGDKRVDLSDNIDILFNWEETDLSNPTVIKNGYSKTVVLDGTNENCEIFGHFWNLERYQSYGGNTGVNYNPSYRVPFTLYYNNAIYERGYVKLQRVISNNGVHQFEIGLFGGLGSFIYNLSNDWNTGNKKTLADLKYYATSASTEEVDLSFTIDKDVVYDAWNHIKSGSTKYSIINFAPTYAGLPSNVDSDKVLINFSGLSITSVSGDCTTYNGYALGKLPDKLTMEEVKDYRSYLQTPVIRVKNVIESICRPENNQGKYDEGYEVICDPDFFCDTNPYYSKSYITLPKLSVVKTNGTGGTPTTIIDSGTSYNNRYSVNNGIVFSYPISVSSDGKARVQFDLETTIENGPSGFLYTSYSSTNMRNVYPAALAIQCYTSNSNTSSENIFTYSNVQWISNTVMTTRGTYRYTFEEGKNDMNVIAQGGNAGVDNYEGSFTKQTGTDVYKLPTRISFDIDIPQNATNLKLNVQWVYPNITGNHSNFKLYNLFGTAYTTMFTSINFGTKNAVFTPIGDSDTYSYSEITKTGLLTTSFSPAEFLINYCKTFGLYMYKDVAEDKIYILTRNNFFKKQDIKKLEDVLDESKEIEINPIYAESNYVSMTTEGIQGASYKDYTDRYGKKYGQKIIDTGYEFNADTKELVNAPFRNAVQTREKSIYFFEKLNGLNPYAYNGFSYSLYKNGSYDNDAITIEIPKKEISQSCNPLYTDKYYDVVSKPQFEDASHKALDTEGVFLFFTGYQDVTDKGYYLTDDNSYMNFLNNRPCWLMTNSEYDTVGNKIATAIEKIPRFSRYLEGNKWMVYSWDYGSPRELYVPEMVNNDEVNLYSIYFKKYYADLYDINTKVVTCYINSNSLDVESLRNIYWFRNGLWRLNKIIDYNPASPETTKCEFIKVQDLDNLTNEEATTVRKIKITLDRYNIGQSGGTIIGTVTTSDNYGWTIEDISYDPSTPAPRGLVTISPLTYGQGGNFTISVPSNIRDDREVTIKVNSPDPEGGNNYASGTTSFEQPGVQYTFSFNPAEFSFGTLSGSSALNIVNPYYYDWNISNKPAWITIVPNAIVNGQTGTTGNTACTLTVEKNTTEVERTGMVTISETTYGRSYTFPVKQAGYVFSVSPNSLSFNKNGETKSVTITNPYGYRWQIQSKPDWISTNIGTATTTGTSITVTASKNIVFQRTGTLVIKELDFNHTYSIDLTQESGYVFSISPTSFSYLCDYELEETLTITNPNQMAWTISNVPNWITVSPTAGTGTSVTVTADENIGFARSYSGITVNETLCSQQYKFDVEQESGYYFELLPATGLSFTSAGTRQYMEVSCKNYNWQIISKPNWITVSPSTGYGDTQVSVTATQNIGYDRTGTIKVKDLDYNQEYTLSVSQASGYYFNVSPTSFTFNSAGTVTSSPTGLTIDNPRGYHWHIADLPVWLSASVESGASTTVVTLTAAGNGWGARSNTFDVYEDEISSMETTINVSQASGYSFSISPNQLEYPSTGDSQTIVINNPYGYTWSAATNVNWISFNQNTGNSSFNLIVTASDNGRGNERYGTVTIYDKSFNHSYSVDITQYGYSFYVTPTQFSFTSAATSVYLQIQDDNNLGWTITNKPAWVSLSSQAGTGDTTITVTVPSNAGNPARSATMVVTETTYQLTTNVSVAQDGGYQFSVSPTAVTFAAAGDVASLTINNPYNHSWEIQENSGWMTFSPESGTGSDTVLITAAPNPSQSERTHRFMVWDNTSSFGVDIDATQAGSKLTPTWTSFTADLI